MTSNRGENPPPEREESASCEWGELGQPCENESVREFLTAGGRRGLTTEQMFPG